MENLIVKYLTDNLTNKEFNTLSKWLEEDNNKKVFNEYIEINQKINYRYNSISTETAFKKAMNQIHNKKNKLRIYRYAAFLALIFTLSLGGYNLFKKTLISNTNYISLELDNGKIVPIDLNSSIKTLIHKNVVIGKIKEDTLIYNKNLFNEIHTINVPKGKMLSVIFSDNTKATINSDSRIKFYTNFDKQSKREVSVNGEVFFDVFKNETKPFIVNTKDISIHVLGTRFNVSNYINDKKTSVVLEEGSVKIKFNSKKGNSISLKPGEKFVISDKKIEKGLTFIDKHLAWRKKQLYFKEDTFEDIIKKLERHYNVNIICTSQIQNNKRYTGSFFNETIEDVFNSFKEISNFNYTITENKITIYYEK